MTALDFSRHRWFAVAVLIVTIGVVAAISYWLGTAGGAVRVDIAPTDAQPPPGAGAWTLIGQFQGPLKDTIVQRWNDKALGVVCYIYMPVIVQHSPPVQNGVVAYGSNGIGTISCVQAKPTIQAP